MFTDKQLKHNISEDVRELVLKNQVTLLLQKMAG